MRVRHLLLASMMVLGLVVVTSPANAAVIDWTIQVQNLTTINDLGTATSSSGILDVSVNIGDTLRFTIGIAAATATTVSSYNTNVIVDDPLEILYTPGTGMELTGLNFAPFADPDFQFGDATPGTGNIASNNGSVGAVVFYEVNYVVQIGLNSDAGVDFSVSGIFATSGLTDTASSSPAEVRLNLSASPVPEPATMLLLGSGLAGLAGFGRRKVRR